MEDNLSAKTIRKYIEDQFLVTWGQDFFDDTDLFQAGIMDSFGYVRLVGFLQSTFGLVFDDEEILTNVMVSCDRMFALIAVRQVQGRGI
jgi:D-alanine--poly(phosphoribitol) ligase subunit 2